MNFPACPFRYTTQRNKLYRGMTLSEQTQEEDANAVKTVIIKHSSINPKPDAKTQSKTGKGQNSINWAKQRAKCENQNRVKTRQTITETRLGINW